jgi:hypothetical protein
MPGALVVGYVDISLGHDRLEARGTHAFCKLFNMTFLTVNDGWFSWLDIDLCLLFPRTEERNERQTTNE